MGRRDEGSRKEGEGKRGIERREGRKRVQPKGPNKIMKDRKKHIKFRHAAFLRKYLNYCPVVGLGDKRQPCRFGQRFRHKMQRKVSAGHDSRRHRAHSFSEEQTMIGGLGAFAPGKAWQMSQKVP